MGAVAHGDDDLGVDRARQVAWRGVSKIEPGATCGGDGFGMHVRGWVGARAVGDAAGAVAPQCGGEMGACRVVGAHEQHRPGRTLRCDVEVAHRGSPKPDVPPPAVARGAEPLDHPGGFEYVEVMGQQVRRQVEEPCQLVGCAIRARQFVDDGQAMRLTERSVHRRPLDERVAASAVVAPGSHRPQPISTGPIIQQTLSELPLAASSWLASPGIRMWNTYVPNKTISVPDDVLPIIESLDMPFSRWVTEQLRRHAVEVAPSLGDQLLADAALAVRERPRRADAARIGERMERSAPW